MALQVKYFDMVGSGLQVDLGANDDLFVAAGVIVASTDGDAVQSIGSNHDAHIWGTVAAHSIALTLGNYIESGSSQHAYVHKGGIVFSSYYGVSVAGAKSLVKNEGHIEAEFGVYVGGVSNSSVTRIINSGTIISDNTGIQHSQVATEDLQISNSGLIESSKYAFDGHGCDARETILNSGRIIGDLLFDYGDDRYDGRSGSLKGVAYGGDGADVLLGGKGSDVFDGGAGRDSLSGGGGTDRLIGGLSRDILTGGTSADRFVFYSKQESATTASARDLIQDFSHAQHDIIELRGIDARQVASGNNAFSFIGTAAFGKHEGELHYRFVGGNTLIEGDIDGNKTADFAIELHGKIALVAGDFLL